MSVLTPPSRVVKQCSTIPVHSKGDILAAEACCRPHFHASPPAKPVVLLVFSQTLSSLILPSSLKFKCMFHKPYFPVRSKHRCHIKAAGRRLPLSVRQAVILRRSADAALLRPVHRLQRIARLPVSAVFHFHKHQVSAIAGDDVDLSLPASEIVSNQLVSLFLQILPPPVSHTLFPSAACSSGILSPCLSSDPSPRSAVRVLPVPSVTITASVICLQ